MGQPRYRKARALLITADSCGSNGSRVRVWKWEQRKLADTTKLSIMACHVPPGTSKWNTIEHRLFASISKNWRGQPLISLTMIASLIAQPEPREGSKCGVKSTRQSIRSPKGTEGTDQQMSELNIERYAFHGDWSYTIHPKSRKTPIDSVISWQPLIPSKLARVRTQTILDARPPPKGAFFLSRHSFPPGGESDLELPRHGNYVTEPCDVSCGTLAQTALLEDVLDALQVLC